MATQLGILGYLHSACFSSSRTAQWVALNIMWSKLVAPWEVFTPALKLLGIRSVTGYIALFSIVPRAVLNAWGFTCVLHHQWEYFKGKWILLSFSSSILELCDLVCVSWCCLLLFRVKSLWLLSWGSFPNFFCPPVCLNPLLQLMRRTLSSVSFRAYMALRPSTPIDPFCSFPLSRTHPSHSYPSKMY
jgi:hypothetical protein